MKLYQLQQEIELALEQYYNCFNEDGELIDEELYNKVTKEIEDLQNQKDELKTWILQKRQNTIGEAEMLKLEITRLQDLLNSKQKEITKSESFIRFLFKDTLEKPLVFGNWKLGFRKSKAVIITDEEKLEKYKKEKISYSIDKTEIKKDLESGVEIEGAIIEERNNFYIK